VNAITQGKFHLRPIDKPDTMTKQFAEKVNSECVLVAQALLPVLNLQHLRSAHSQEWLCYSTFSANCKTGRDAPAGENRRHQEIDNPRWVGDNQNQRWLEAAYVYPEFPRAAQANDV
jgi:hypothetical protein